MARKGARYFDTRLTGSGKARGLLSADRDPSHVQPPVPDWLLLRASDDNVVYTKGSDGTTVIPIAFVPFLVLSQLDGLSLPGWETMTPCATSDGRSTYRVMLVPDGITLLSPKGTADGTQMVTTWILVIACLPSGYAGEVLPLRPSLDDDTSGVCVVRTQDPSAFLVDRYGRAFATAALSDVSLAKVVAAEADVWSEHVVDAMRWLTSCLPVDGRESILRLQIAHMTSYEISFLDYYAVNDVVARAVGMSSAAIVARDNQMLLFATLLAQLQQVKPTIAGLPDTAHEVSLDPRLTEEQRAAVSATEPLALVSAGAGTGKSSIIKHRLGLMRDIGIPMSDVMVLSFTNAAADHIGEIYPDVKSSTIASFMHQVYAANHPNQTIASAVTLCNALSVWFPYDEVAIDLRQCLRRVTVRPTVGSWVLLSDYVVRREDHVVALLDSCRMTTLEMETVMTYNQIDRMMIPDDLLCRYVIVDEVQDTSLFEFAYLFRYAIRCRASLYLVGDACQSLYEFRGASPEMMSAIIETGIFASYVLQVNFRSDQPILDYANDLLSTIGVNRATDLRLRPPDPHVVNGSEFHEHVGIMTDYDTAYRQWYQRGLHDTLGQPEVRAFVCDAIAAGRTVAVLTRSRTLAATAVESISRYVRPSLIRNACAARTAPVTTFSDFCMRHWGEALFSQSPMDDIPRLIPGYVDDDDKSLRQLVENACREWHARTEPLYAEWQAYERANRLTHGQVLDALRASLISYENHVNAMLRQTADDAMTLQSAPVIVSTIHSVKGLEFDDVVIDYDDRNEMSEEDKRMYYVALTRARHHELLLVHGDETGPCLANWRHHASQRL